MEVVHGFFVLFSFLDSMWDFGRLYTYDIGLQYFIWNKM